MDVVTRHLDGPEGRWTHVEWRPAHLRALVDYIWYFDGWVRTPRERVFPSGLLELIVQLDTPHREIAPRPTSRYPAVCATGLMTGPVVIEAPRGRCRVLGIQLHPAGAYALLDGPLFAFADLTVDLADLVGGAAVELAERCEAAGSDEERVREAVRWVEERLAWTRRADAVVAWAATQIAARPRLSVTELRETTGLSKTRLLALFREQVGVTPKRFQRMHRFRRALTLLRERRRPLTDIALEAGYYDQPHFNLEFREMAGLTPGAFLRAAQYPMGVNLPEPAD